MSRSNLEEVMSHCTGTESYHSFPLFPQLHFTDGVMTFIETANAWWFVSDTIIEIIRLTQNHPDAMDFTAVDLTVKDEKAEVVFKDGDNNVWKKKKYGYTDCPDCVLTFFFIDKVFLYSGEY